LKPSDIAGSADIAVIGVSAFTGVTGVSAFTEATGVPAFTDTEATAAIVGAALACIATAGAGETVYAPAHSG